MAAHTVAIIGTAGRRGDVHRLTAAHFASMVTAARSIIRQMLRLSPSQVHLVSGGSSFADHVAVTLYLESVMGQQQEESTADTEGQEAYAGLTLHLPAPFHTGSTSASSVHRPYSSPPSSLLPHTSHRRHHCGCAASASYPHPHFLDNGDSSWKTNPGRVLNGYHAQFNSVMNRPGAVQPTTSQPAVNTSRYVHSPSSSSAVGPDMATPSLATPATHPAPRPPPPPSPRSASLPSSGRFSSFHDLATASAMGAKLRVVDDAQRHGGSDAFHWRNSLVAQSQHLIAFTFGGSLSVPSSRDSSSSSSAWSALLSSPSNQPCPGGTADTWSKCRGNRVHVPLHHLLSPPLTRCLLSSSATSVPPLSTAPSTPPSTTLPPARPAAAHHQQRSVRRRDAGDGEEETAGMAPRKKMLTAWLQRGNSGTLPSVVC